VPADAPGGANRRDLPRLTSDGPERVGVDNVTETFVSAAFPDLQDGVADLFR